MYTSVEATYISVDPLSDTPSMLAFPEYLLGAFRFKYTRVLLLLPRSCICHVLTLRLPHFRSRQDRCSSFRLLARLCAKARILVKLGERAKEM
uniref:Uncharacterized protein n=1 Tax=Utricularia reniformis TaxID=192314 RepID=A0A1Y0B0W2_9LAMI|nr:hypothetical protein AEK19_MT0760 [Utricularia reniformis]ART31003.1 hypothetical protein AEK19_MT0760 [Utricularia reniformis]